MITISINKIFKWAILAIFVFVFLLGGFIQFFIGVSSTLYSLLIVGIIYLLIVFHCLVTFKIYVNKVVLVCALFILLIVFSGLVNGTEVSKIILYFLFGLLPMGIFLLFQILRRRKVPVRNAIHQLSRIIVFLQLPIILIQKYGYHLLIGFNKSNQAIADYDFMFGTFFIRADHALGFFLLIYLIKILINLKKANYRNVPWFTIIYIGITILVMESNLSKMFLIIVLSFYFFLWLYIKIKLLGIILIAVSSILIFNIALKIPVLAANYDNFSRNYTIKKSKEDFERTTAKRLQIGIVYATQMPLKLIGEGPYDYFNIFNGKFKKTKHFSQLIWSYNDLGIIGLSVTILLGFVISLNLGLGKEHRRLFVGLILFYLLMTNVYADLAICLSMLLIDEKIE